MKKWLLGLLLLPSYSFAEVDSFNNLFVGDWYKTVSCTGDVAIHYQPLEGFELWYVPSTKNYDAGTGATYLDEPKKINDHTFEIKGIRFKSDKKHNFFATVSRNGNAMKIKGHQFGIKFEGTFYQCK